MFVNPGTLFIPLTPCSGASIIALHTLKAQHSKNTTENTDANTDTAASENTDTEADADTNQDTYAEQYSTWANTTENVNYICQLGACIGASIPQDIDFDFAVELFTKYLHQGTYDSDAREAVIRYRIATQYVSHPTFGPGLLIIGAQRAYEITRFIDDIMLYGEVIDPDTGNAHMPVLHASCVFDTSTGGVTVSDDTSTAWCEAFDATTAPANSGSDGEPNGEPAKYPTGTLITVYTVPSDEAQYEPTATYNVSTAVEFWLDNRHHDFDAAVPTTNTATTNTAAEKEYRHSDGIPPNLDYGSDTESTAHNSDLSNTAPLDIPDHTAEGYSMEQTKPFDDLLGTILRSVASQIEQHGSTHLNETARADRDATLATLTAAATMVENQAQHVDTQITDTVLDNLATLAQRMEAHNTALDEADTEKSSTEESSEQPEIPLDDVIDDTTVPLDTLIEDSDTESDSTAESASFNPAEATLTEVATLSQMRIKQFINRAEF